MEPLSPVAEPSPMEALPLDMLVYLLMFVGPQHLYNGNLASVSRMWLEAMRSLTPSLRKGRWDAYALSTAPILPRQMTLAAGSLDLCIMSLDDRGRVMCMTDTSLISVDDGKRRQLRPVVACDHSKICTSFGMVGELLYFRGCNTVYLYNRAGSTPTFKEHFPNVPNACCIRTYGAKVWILGNDDLCAVRGTTIVSTLSVQPGDAMWLDFVVEGDIVFISTVRGVLMYKDGKRSDIGLPGGLLHQHNGELYVYATSEKTVYVRAADGTVRSKDVGEHIISLAVVGNCLCAAVTNAILVCRAKGPPVRIPSYRVKHILAANNKLYALSSTGVLSIYTQ